MKKAVRIITSLILSFETCVQVLPVSASGGNYVPDGTQIKTSITGNTATVTVSCNAGNECTAFLQEVEKGKLYLHYYPSDTKI